MSGKLRSFASKWSTEIKEHWSTPAKGKYVPYKEYFSVLGGISFNYGMNTPSSYIGFAASCYLIMYHYNIPYLTFAVITLLTAPLGYLSDFMSWVVTDNLGFLAKKTERKMLIAYAIATAVGIALMCLNLSTLLELNSDFADTVNSLSGINTKTIFNILGVQIFVAGFSGLRSILWRKKLVPKVGRYKYTIYCNVIQRGLLFILLGWLPIYKISDVCERVWLLYLLIQVFDAYNVGTPLSSCADVISPNLDERLAVRTWPQKFGHLFNTVLEFLVPIIIAWLPGSFSNINVYRYVIPGIYIICGILTVVFAPKIKERIPQPPLDKKVKISFWDGIFGVMRNKYRWLDTISSLIDSLGNGALNLITVMLIYTLRVDGIIYSICTMMFSFVCMTSFLAPAIMKRFNYRQLKIFQQTVKCISVCLHILFIWLFKSMPTVCGILMVLNQSFMYGITEISSVATSDMSIRLSDYQMYLSGERLDSFTGIFKLIISPVTTVVGLIIPLLLLRNGYNSNWDILFVDSARSKILIIPLAMDALGYALMIIPYIFWDYDDKKHQKVIEELKRRAHALGGQDFQ